MTGLATIRPQLAKDVSQLAGRVAPRWQGLLERKDLIRLLDRAATKRVTIISAPPGSGKTSLLHAWAESLADVRRVAFVSVERDQADEARFWLDVLDAIRSPMPSIDPEAPPTFEALNVDQVVDSVLGAVAEQVLPVVLIIDDLHELSSPAALGQLEYFLARLPRSAHVVLSSRRDPAMRLHQLRLADAVAEIRAADLRFTERETRELLAGSSIVLSAAGVAALWLRTEGWAAGLRLAVISLSGHPDPERFVDDFSGTDRAIGEYLMAEMLERHPIEVQKMLLRTSLVDRMNGELADLLTGHSGSERMLLALEEANAFVVSLDAQRTWFRYHQLLAEFLRLELRRTLAHEVGDLHRRAAGWFADRGDVLEAVRHTVAAGDWPGAARLVADHSFRWVLNGQAETIRAVLQAFPEGASIDHPDLALANAANELNQGRMEDAAAQLTLAESHVQNAPPARRHRLVVAIASLRLALARRSGNFGDVIDQVNLLDASVADGSNEPIAMDSELRAVALLNLGIAETWCRRFDDAERHLSEGAALAQAMGRPYLEVACRAHQVFPTTLVSLASVRERGRLAVALAEQHGLGDRPILAPALGALAFWAIWVGDFDEGESALHRAREITEPQSDPAAEALLHLVTGMLHVARGQHQAALEAFATGARVQSLLTGVHSFPTPVVGWLAATQARLGMPAEARAMLTGFSAEDQRTDFICNARAVICLTEGDPTAALDLLQDLRDAPAPVGVPAFMLVETHLLAGIAHLHLAERKAAAAAAEAALAAAEPHRLVFPFVMADSADLLDVLPRHETAHGALLADVLDLLRGGSRSGFEREPRSQSEELSPSELRVLGYLPTNLTRPEIAHQLHVSINTVNTHIRNLYAKLGAQDRSAAVHRARELRMLSHRLSPPVP